jgi:FixJ family two-component response regulator
MSRCTVIILEDNEERIRDFEAAVKSLGLNFQLRLWHDAHTMIAECAPFLTECCLISLDHDLNPMPTATKDPGTGLEVSEFLAHQESVCPVIIHTSNTERRWSMHNEFRFGKWTVEIVPPIGENWIQNSWLPKAKVLIG